MTLGVLHLLKESYFFLPLSVENPIQCRIYESVGDNHLNQRSASSGQAAVFFTC